MFRIKDGKKAEEDVKIDEELSYDKYGYLTLGSLSFTSIKKSKVYNLSESSDIEQARLNLYKFLRMMEEDTDINVILIDDELLDFPVLGDRVYRACQGRYFKSIIDKNDKISIHLKSV